MYYKATCEYYCGKWVCTGIISGCSPVSGSLASSDGLEPAGWLLIRTGVGPFYASRSHVDSVMIDLDCQVAQ